MTKNNAPETFWMIKKSKFVPFAFTVLVIGLAALRRARNRQSTAENVSGVKKVTTIFAGLSQCRVSELSGR